MTSVRFLDAGETALVVEFGAEVDPAVNDRVLALDAALSERALAGVHESVPTYRSLMIHYDPLVLERAVLIETIRTIEADPLKQRAPVDRWTIPCCYDPSIAEDLNEVSAMTGLTPERVVALHSGATYRVYMYGFAPGFCYLGGSEGTCRVAAGNTTSSASAEHGSARRRADTRCDLRHADGLVDYGSNARAYVCA